MKNLLLKLVLLAVCLLSAQSAFAQSCSNTNIGNGWTCVISVSAQTSDTNSVTTGAVDTSTANLLLCGVANYTLFSDPPCTDSKSNTWIPLTPYSDSTTYYAFRWYYCSSPCTVGTNHTFSSSDLMAASYPAIGVFALKTATATPFDIQAGAGTTGTQSTLQVSLGTPNQVNSVLVTGVNLGTASSVASIDLSYSIKEQIAQSAGVAEGIAIAIKTQSTAASSAPTWTFSGADNVGGSGIAAFKQGTAPSSGAVCLKSLLGVGGC